MKVSMLGWSLAVVLASALRVRADALAVIELSEQDHAAADKLEELIREPFARTQGELPTLRGSPASLCESDEGILLILDSAHNAVRLVRCRDGAVLARELDPDAARQTPYLAAFVAAELLDLNAQLEDVRVEPLIAPAAPAAPAPTRAPPPNVPTLPVDAAEASRNTLRLRLRVGAESMVVGAPFEAMPRPTLGVGLAIFQAWLVELQVSLLAGANLAREGEHLSLTRSVSRLRAGLQLPFGPFAVAGMLHARASFTQADYGGETRSSKASLRLGLGAGLEGNWALTSWLLLYGDTIVDVATSRSDYLIHTDSWVQDPKLVFTCSLGLIVHAQL
jgi:hypothetical protein